jgi:hypothetical protein
LSVPTSEIAMPHTCRPWLANAAAAGAQISIANLAFAPASITILKGVRFRMHELCDRVLVDVGGRLVKRIAEERVSTLSVAARA